MSWYKVTLSNAEVANGKAIQLQDAFGAIFIGLGGPPDAGMFGSLDIMSNDYFFSPGAVRIAKLLITAYGGSECLPPKGSEVALLVSHAGAESISFAPEIPDA